MGESQHQDPGSYFLELRNIFFAFFWVKILKFFDEDPGSGFRDGDSSDPGWKKVGSGIKIPDPHPCFFCTCSKKRRKRVTCLFYE
jgi:hypothetical protein